MDKLWLSIKKRQDECNAALDALDPTRPCQTHAGAVSVLNRDASWGKAEGIYDCQLCQDENEAEERRLLIERSDVPSDVQHATLDNFKVDRSNVRAESGFMPPAAFLAAARRFQAGEIRNVVFAGTPGIGKGHLAGALAIEELDKGNRIAWADCAGLFSDYHRAYKTGETEDLILHYATARLLVLDEICLRELPSDGEEILYAILDKRHKAGRRTILLGNKTAAESRKWLGSRISDRLRSGGIAFCYGEWDSMRGQEEDGSF